MGQTVMEVFAHAVKAWADQPALKQKRNGAWKTWTWKEYDTEMRRAARGFMAIGLEPGQGVAIIGFNSPEWFMADIGAIHAGGVPAGIYTTSTAEQCQYIAGHCDAAVAVVQNDVHLAKFLEIRDQLPVLKGIVMIEGASSEEGVYSWSELLALGDGVPAADFEARIAAQKPDDVATLIYTSGTTGQPKAVMISHDNMTWTAKQALSTVDMHPGELVLSYLPLSHIAEQVVSLHGPIAAGMATCFAEGMDELGDNLREIRPHLFLGVPRVWEKIQAKVMAAGAQNSGLKKRIAAWARKKGLAGGMAGQYGKSLPFGYGLADKLVFSKVRERLGLDRCRVQITSAAPIGRDTLDFFLSLGVPIFEVYGMSECTGPATLSTPSRYRTGKAGWCLPGAELKIAEDGEVCMRGRHVFKGYFKNEAATAETIDAEGWLHSGDIGVIDGDGFLQITDRKKDLIITAGGENIAPQVIEGMLKAIPVVSQAVVIGDKRKYLTALLTLDPERVPTDAAAAGSPAKDANAAAACPTFNAWLMKEVEAVNGKLARVQTIKKLTIIPSDFSIEGGELTPTMKIKRKVVRDKYSNQIEAMY
ncbi:MAG: long-chain fatty acid--CoA ligase [Deltaproteobacteria bacterium]|nr:MAG: long-chain fatty acid--CoA ligase [Deltaproteobacteria bacterium]